MRTNIVLDDAIVKQAFRYTTVKTKRELVDLALREFVATRQRKDLRELFGTGGVRDDYDYKKLRADRRAGV